MHEKQMLCLKKILTWFRKGDLSLAHPKVGLIKWSQQEKCLLSVFPNKFSTSLSLFPPFIPEFRLNGLPAGPKLSVTPHFHAPTPMEERKRYKGCKYEKHLSSGQGKKMVTKKRHTCYSGSERPMAWAHAQVPFSSRCLLAQTMDSFLLYSAFIYIRLFVPWQYPSEKDWTLIISIL
jgi:hypothetical protein